MEGNVNQCFPDDVLNDIQLTSEETRTLFTFKKLKSEKFDWFIIT